MVGESGSGKSVTAMAAMGLVEAPGRVTAGAVRFSGVDLFGLPEEERRRVRGPGMAMVFQDPLSALNPVFSVGFQIGEMLRVHAGMSRRAARARAVELLEQVRIPGAAGRVGDYPHQFSGGMRQRVMIAMALALGPRVLVADEPTTALDVTVQAQILELLADLRVRSRAWACSSSPTTSAWWPRWPTGWRSCTPGGSWRRAPPPTCWWRPVIPTPRGCSTRCRAGARESAWTPSRGRRPACRTSPPAARSTRAARGWWTAAGWRSRLWPVPGGRASACWRSEEVYSRAI